MARCNKDVKAISISIPCSFNFFPDVTASVLPCSDKSTSAQPVNRFSAFQTLCPCLHKISFGIIFLLSIRSEEHTSELQSRFDLVCRLLLEKKKIITICAYISS